MVGARANHDDPDRSYAPIAFWTLIVILAAFVVSDGVQAWRRRHLRNAANGEPQA